MAVIVPFPRTRDRRFVVRQARVMAAYGPEAAEKHLAVQLERQRTVLTRRGVAPELVDEHVGALEMAIRGALWLAMTRTPGGAA